MKKTSKKPVAKSVKKSTKKSVKKAAEDPTVTLSSCNITGSQVIYEGEAFLIIADLADALVENAEAINQLASIFTGSQMTIEPTIVVGTVCKKDKP